MPNLSKNLARWPADIKRSITALSRLYYTFAFNHGYVNGTLR